MKAKDAFDPNAPLECLAPLLEHEAAKDKTRAELLDALDAVERELNDRRHKADALPSAAHAAARRLLIAYRRRSRTLHW